MTEEREVLVKKIFPQIRDFCLQRNVFFTFVDLRWGITREEFEMGNTISLCLQQIDSCRPYFISMLGSRYGSCLATSPDSSVLLLAFEKASKEYPWILEYKDRSITELEILHAALNNPSLRFVEHAKLFI
jgi:nephrocystin-3